jgi:hypothetical protein
MPTASDVILILQVQKHCGFICKRVLILQSIFATAITIILIIIIRFTDTIFTKRNYARVRNNTRPIPFHSSSLICDFCLSGQCFACSFLQIPLHGGHPAVRLTFAPVGYVMDLMNRFISKSSKCALRSAPMKKAAPLKGVAF